MTTPHTREQNRKDMAMLYNKSNFLRNPRHRPPSAQGGGRSLVKPNTITHQLGGAKSTVIDTGLVFDNHLIFSTHLIVILSIYHLPIPENVWDKHH